MKRTNEKLRRLLVALGAAFFLILSGAGIAAAQETENEQQKRTRSHSESWGPGQGLTLVGEVVSWDDDSLQVETTTGTENIVLTPETRMAVDRNQLKKGLKVAVDYNRSTQGAIIASQVRLGNVQGIDKDRNAGGVEMSQSPILGDLYLMGTVVTFDDDLLVLRTADGERTVVVTPVTKRTYVYKAGDPVLVDYDRDESGRMMAEEITQADTANDEQRRTRAHAESWGPGQGLTMVGEVRSVNRESLVVNTTTGAENVVLTPETRILVEDLDPGDRVAVDYVRTTQGALIAEQVRRGSEVRGISDR
jgi:ATP-dependent 26S proteasome regulatory subunit